MGSGLIRWAHFRAISVCARCRSVSATWVEGFRSRALQGKEPTFSRKFQRESRLGMIWTCSRAREKTVQQTSYPKHQKSKLRCTYLRQNNSTLRLQDSFLKVHNI